MTDFRRAVAEMVPIPQSGGCHVCLLMQPLDESLRIGRHPVPAGPRKGEPCPGEGAPAFSFKIQFVKSEVWAQWLSDRGPGVAQ